MKNFLTTHTFIEIREALSRNPAVANEGIPYDDQNTTKAHPLHRICDGVFSGIFTDTDGVELAKLFLEYGADINGNNIGQNRDTPLTAASSLHADLVALFYIEKGADIHYAGAHGGTALHWAAWCGRDKVVARLIQEGADINKLCADFKSTPLFWAVHGLKTGAQNGLQNYVDCVTLLIHAGADKNVPNGNGKTVFDLLNDQDLDIKKALGC